MVVNNDVNRELDLFETLIDKIKKSKKLSISRRTGTKYLSRRLFKFDTFDMCVSFDRDNNFIRRAAYGRVEIDSSALNNPHEIADITVMDKQGKVIFIRSCSKPVLEKGSSLKAQKLRFDKGQKIYDLLLKRTQEIAVKNEATEQLKHAIKNMSRLNRIKSSQDPEKIATIRALKKIKEL